MNDIPKSSQIVIGVASLVVLCSLAYIFVRWLRSTERPWIVIVGMRWKALLVLQGYGIYLMLSGVYGLLLVFLASHFFGEKLASNDRSYFLHLAWSQFLVGAAVLAMAVAIRRRATLARGYRA